MSREHRASVEESLKRTGGDRNARQKLKRWVLVTPTDFIESATRKDGGDVTWFESLRKRLKLPFEVEHWGHENCWPCCWRRRLLLCLFYYPELVDPGETRRRTLADTRERYNSNLSSLYRDIQFVGMSVYKAEATRGIALQDIYIPLTLVPDGASGDTDKDRTDPLMLLPKARVRSSWAIPGRENRR